jgi:hypothetical protein
MSQAILNQIVNQLEMLEFFELQELERAIANIWLTNSKLPNKSRLKNLLIKSNYFESGMPFLMRKLRY